MHLGYITCVLVALMLLGGCKEKSVVKVIQADRDLSTIQDEAINVLKSKKIFFGHASVGYNIISGMENIKATDTRFAKINIRELKDSDDVNMPGFYHSGIGKNGFPDTKIDGFKNLLRERGLGNRLDIAFLKFCYVDFNKGSNVEEVFGYYSKVIGQVKQEFPKLRIVHVTTPLYAHAWGVKGFIKNLMYDDISNVKRNDFNTLLIARYKDIDPIYDLATIESTLPDGSRVTFKHNGKKYFSLSKEYTSDGGHLNDLGKLNAARELLITLCNSSVDTDKK